jgi:hypothetical protein
MKTTTFRLKNPRPPSGHVLSSCTLLRLAVVAASETIVAAIFNRSRVLGVGAVCLQHGGWSAGCHVRGENVNVCVCVCCVLCIRSRSRSGRTSPRAPAEGNVPDNNRRGRGSIAHRSQSHSPNG